MARDLSLAIRHGLIGRLRRARRWVDHLPEKDSDTTVGQLALQLQYQQLAALGIGLPPVSETGWDRYTRGGEDGMLVYLFGVLGFGTRRAIDLGGGSVGASNTLNLVLHHGFDVCVVDGDERSVSYLRRYLDRHPLMRGRTTKPTLLTEWITRESIGPMIKSAGFEGDVDLLSIDLDGVDYWILEAVLDTVAPRVLIVEYQDHLGPHRAWTVPYSPDFSIHDHPVNADDAYLYCGAGLLAFDRLLRPRGYRFVGSNRDGYNALFVRDDDAAKAIPHAPIESAFASRWTQWGMEHRFPLVADMQWEEV